MFLLASVECMCRISVVIVLFRYVDKIWKQVSKLRLDGMYVGCFVFIFWFVGLKRPLSLLRCFWSAWRYVGPDESISLWRTRVTILTLISFVSFGHICNSMYSHGDWLIPFLVLMLALLLPSTIMEVSMMRAMILGMKATVLMTTMTTAQIASEESPPLLLCCRCCYQHYYQGFALTRR